MWADKVAGIWGERAETEDLFIELIYYGTSLFNDSQIEQVFFKGFEDQEEIDFKKNLNKTVNEYYEKNTIKVDDIVDKPQPTATFDINNNIFDNIGD